MEEATLDSTRSRMGSGTYRKDLIALWAGILFSLAFTGLIWWVGARLADVPHLPDAGASWYYWTLPEATFWGRATAWPMFAFGFGGVFVITQMHGLGLSKRTRWLILLLYIAAALWIYSDRGLVNIHQITWIPIIDYLGVLVLAGLIGFGLWVASRFRDQPKVSKQHP